MGHTAFVALIRTAKALQQRPQLLQFRRWVTERAHGRIKMIVDHATVEISQSAFFLVSYLRT
jgi:hypothetical protein